jgi:hypothetical protein
MVNAVSTEPEAPPGVAVPPRLAPQQEPDVTDPRPSTRETETEDQRAPAREGEPPRPATEPHGAEGSSNPGDTATDPATGKPNP